MSYQGLSTVTVEQIMEDVSYALVEPKVNTTLGTIVPAPGSVSVTPASMIGIYPGAFLLVGVVGANQEQITVASVTATTFTAVFAFTHAVTDPVIGATFPSGQPDHPLFTQNEIIGYIADVQNDFLLKTRCIYSATDQVAGLGSHVNFVIGNRTYSFPLSVIRAERLSSFVPGQHSTDLYETTQSDLDMSNADWPADADFPRQWFRDQQDTSVFGLYPLPNVSGFVNFWYSVAGSLAVNLTLLSNFLIPDSMAHFIKYGTLARCWSKNGEFRDPLRSEYCQKRFDMGVMLTLKFLDGVQIDTKAPKASFSPMAVPR